MGNEVKQSWGATLVVANAGHVWFAREVTYTGEFYHLHGARIVRRWGTETGLNSLTNGPTKETILDAEAPLVIVVAPAMLALIPCVEGAWKA
jgi:hypothetical protein